MCARFDHGFTAITRLRSCSLTILGSFGSKHDYWVTLTRGANARRPLPDVASNPAATSTRDMPQGPKAPIADPAGVSNMTAEQHKSALQALSNGQPVTYPATLRTVVHAGTKAPKREDQDPDKKPPGYSRNARGGFFTS